MAFVDKRDESTLGAGFARWLAHRRGLSNVTLSGLRRPSAGYSSETIMVDAAWPASGGLHRESFVIRMAPARVRTFPHYDLVSQWRAQSAAAAVGVPVADPLVEADPHWLGAPFMVMSRIEGHVIGSVAHLDTWLRSLDQADQGRLYRNFLSTLSAIHRADAGQLDGVPRRDNRAELDFWDDYLVWSSGGNPVPALVDALRWCRHNRPGTEPQPVLLWGDARFENMVIGDHLAPLAVLDWDMTSVGAPEHDLAWFTSLDLTMHQIFGERLGGFPTRSETVELFEECSDRAVRDLEWYETLAMVRSAAVMTRIGYLRRAAGKPLLLPIEDNPILNLLKSRTA